MSISDLENGILNGANCDSGADDNHEVESEVIDYLPDENDGSGNLDLMELLSRMRNSVASDDDDDDCDMDADDYHNKAVDYARNNKKKQAAELCIQGLMHFPLNVDLLSDTIKYSYEAGDIDTAAEYYETLKESVPTKRWNWRAYTFSFDYLLALDPAANEEECRTIIENYKKYIPYEEKASMAESELEAALGNTERSMNVLEEAIRLHENASQCALRLSDMQMYRGLYEKVIDTANYGIAASAEAQPSINVPYLYYLRTLAKDHILHKKECDNQEVKAEEVNALAEEYEMLLGEFPELMRYGHTIKMREKMLKFIKTA